MPEVSLQFGGLLTLSLCRKCKKSVKNVIFAFVMESSKYSLLRFAVICILCIVIHQDFGWAHSDATACGWAGSECLSQDIDYSVKGCSMVVPFEQEGRIPRKTGIGSSLRTLSQVGRLHNTSTLRNSGTAIRGCGSLTRVSAVKYQLLLESSPSGLREVHNHFISLGKLVI